MRYFFAAIFTICVSGACNTTKSSASTTNLSALEGTWQLNYITGPRIAFEELYPDNKPTITFEIKREKVVGIQVVIPFR
jgi:heat shock protein HslJ